MQKHPQSQTEHRSQSRRGVAWGDHLSGSPAPWRAFWPTGGAVVPPAASTQNLQQLRSGEGPPWQCRPAVKTHNKYLEIKLNAQVDLTTEVVLHVSPSLPHVQDICHSTAAVDELKQGWDTCGDGPYCWSWGSSYTGGRWRWPNRRRTVQQSHTLG